MMKLIEWMKASNRIKHLIGGFILGLGSNTLYCAAYVGVSVASALELKDHLKGGAIDMLDWAITLFGTSIGYLVRAWAVSMLIV